MTEHLVKQMKHGKSVRSPQEVQQLADEMSNAYVVLGQLHQLQEVDSQAVILEVVQRLQPYVQIKWKKHALAVKKNSGCIQASSHW